MLGGSGASMGASQADRLRTLILDETLPLGLSQIILGLHEMCSSITSAHLKEAVGIIWARFPFLLFLGLFQTMHRAIRYLVRVSLLMEATFVWLFNKLINGSI